MATPAALLSKKKFTNSKDEPTIGYKGVKSVTPGAPDAITMAVFFDTKNAPSIAPFWICFNDRCPVGVAVDKICKAVTVTNKNNTAQNDDDKWFLYSLTPQEGNEKPFEFTDELGDVIESGDVVYVGKGPILPEGMAEHAEARIAAMSGPAKVAPAVVFTKVAPVVPAKGAATKAAAVKKQHEIATAENANLQALLSQMLAQATAKEAAAKPVKGAAPTTSASSEGPFTVKATFPELEGLVIDLIVADDDLVSDVLDQLRRKQPEATKQGVKIMFYEKYVKKYDDSVRAVPLGEGSAIDVCTGKYLSENEMTLYLADRHLNRVKAAASAHKGMLLDANLRAYWNEQLMKSLTLLDSLQEVPEEIRARRRAAVKLVIAEQDALAEMK